MLIKSINQFQELIKDNFVIIQAKSYNCSICTSVSNQLENLLSNYPSFSHHQIYIEDVLEFSGQYLVFTVPTIILFFNGKEILRESRFINFNNIKKLLEHFSDLKD